MSKVAVGTTATVNVALEVGNTRETVTILGGGVDPDPGVTIGTTLIGSQITDIPNSSRNALNLVFALPLRGNLRVQHPRQS